MIHYPVFLSDKAIHDEFEMVEHLTESGIDLLTAKDMVGNVDELEDLRVRHNNVLHELRSYEMSLDNCHNEMNELCDNVLAICEMLESGKKGKGYTKSEIASSLRKMMLDCYNNCF